MLNNINTAFDTMKEYLVFGADFCKPYDIPMVPRCSLDGFPDDSVDFGESFSRNIKNLPQG